jgi:serine/threonine-protein phosphatase 5
VVKFRPKDKDARLKFTECKKIVQKQAFEKAIAVDHEKKSLSESLDVNSIGKYQEHFSQELIREKCVTFQRYIERSVGQKKRLK